MGMVEAGQHLPLGPKPPLHARGVEAALQELHGDGLLIVAGPLGAVDHAHAANANLLGQPIGADGLSL